VVFTQLKLVAQLISWQRLGMVTLRERPLALWRLRVLGAAWMVNQRHRRQQQQQAPRRQRQRHDGQQQLPAAAAALAAAAATAAMLLLEVPSQAHL
jgi:hypothetical protein